MKRENVLSEQLKLLLGVTLETGCVMTRNELRNNSKRNPSGAI